MMTDDRARMPIDYNEEQVRQWGAWVNTDSGSIETRSDEDGGGLRISGYAIVFNQASNPMGVIEEVIDPRALDGIDLSSVDVRLMAEHNGSALARTTNNTLSLSTDEKGLAFVADLNPDVQAARDLYALIDRGDITQMSFGFTIGKTEREEPRDDSDMIHIRITEIRTLHELSAVTFPAYPQTTVATIDGMPERAARGEDKGDGFDDELVALRLHLAHGGATHNGTSQSEAG